MADLHSRYLFIASMDIDPQHESLFNDVYNTEHCPTLNQVPGVREVTRYETQRLVMAMGARCAKLKSPALPSTMPYTRWTTPKC